MEENKIREVIMPLAEHLCKRLSQRLERAHAQGTDRTMNWLECTVWVEMATWARELLVALIGLLYERGGEDGPRLCLACGSRMGLQGYSRRPVLSSFGRFHYERAYYYCRACGYGRAPLDERLGLWDRALSPRLQRVMGYLAGYLSFGVVQQAIAESYALTVSDEAIRQVAEEIGQEVRVWEDRQRAHYTDPAQKPPPRSGAPRTWVIEVDGKKVPLRSGQWPEVKVGVIYEWGDRVETSTGRHELIKRDLVARRGHWQDFAEHFGAALQRVGVCDGDTLVAIGDGGANIEPIFEWVAPEATRIRDFYHVAERVHAIGEVRFGVGTPENQHWCHTQLHKLKASQVDAIVRSIRHLKLPETAEETRRAVLGYFANQRHAMDYAHYQAQGWPLGSGAVEGGCKLIGRRTNGSGRRWSEQGVDQIVALRVAVLTDRLEVVRPRPLIEAIAA